MNTSLASIVGLRFESTVVSHARLAGGDISNVERVELANGLQMVIKTSRPGAPATFTAEAHGLAWLAETRAIRIPEVYAASDGEDGTPPFLALEYLAAASPRPDFDETLGRSLAALHQFGAPAFGLDRDNFIGSLAQTNTESQSWANFYRDHRLAPLLARAKRRVSFTSDVLRDFDRLFARIDDVVGPPEPPARLHGDLWGGNLHRDEMGYPCLIDPAVYAGHREIDLAMMRLFGGFGRRVFQAYDEACPLGVGHQQRVALYQLYPLLVHVNLFGLGYLEEVARALRATLATTNGA